MKTLVPDQRWMSDQSSWLQGGRRQLAGFEEGALLQPPKQVSTFHSQEDVCPDFNKVSSGGSAFCHVVTIQETYENSAYDGENPICPATFA